MLKEINSAYLIVKEAFALSTHAIVLTLDQDRVCQGYWWSQHSSTCAIYHAKVDARRVWDSGGVRIEEQFRPADSFVQGSGDDPMRNFAPLYLRSICDLSAI